MKEQWSYFSFVATDLELITRNKFNMMAIEDVTGIQLMYDFGKFRSSSTW